MFKAYSRKQAKRLSENSDRNFSKLTGMLDKFFGTTPIKHEKKSDKIPFDPRQDYTEEELNQMDMGGKEKTNSEEKNIK